MSKRSYSSGMVPRSSISSLDCNANKEQALLSPEAIKLQDTLNESTTVCFPKCLYIIKKINYGIRFYGSINYS